MKIIAKQSEITLIACLLLINALALFPLLTTGFLFDDIFNSQIRGHMIQTDRSLWGVTAYYINQWLKSSGRLFPLAFCAYPIHYVLENVLLYKLFIMSVILTNVGAFFVFFRKLTGSTLISAIAVMLISVTLQFRASCDPVLAISALYPLLSLMMFCSLTLFLRVLDSEEYGARRSLCMAVFLFMCCGLIFEVTYPMFLIYGAVAFLKLKTFKAAIRSSWPFLAVTLFLVTVSLILRSHAVALSISDYKMNLNVAEITKSYFAQLLGAIPFSYYFFDPHTMLQNRTQNWPFSLLQVLPLLLLLLLFIVPVVWRNLPRIPFTSNTISDNGVLILGILFYTIPPAFISLSPKFQARLMGDAYLPVYVSCFGLCLIIAVGLSKLYKRWNGENRSARWLTRAGFCVFLLLFTFNFRNNFLVAQTLNDMFWNARVLTEQALDKGLLKDNIGEETVLLVEGIEPWDNAELYSQHTELRFSVYRLSETHNIGPALLAAGGVCNFIGDHKVFDFTPDAPVYTIQIRHLTDGTGAVLLARIQKAFYFGDSLRGLFCNDVTAYFRLPASEQRLTTAVSGNRIKKTANGYSMTLFRETEHSLQVVREDRGWRLLSLHSDDLIDAKSLRGEIFKEGSKSIIFTPKEREAFELRSSGPELLHVGYEGDIGNGDELHAITFGNDVSIEVLVTPRASQNAYASILSNHSNLRGFCIEQLNTQTNYYAVAFGTGKEWIEVGRFPLVSGCRNYIALQLKDGEARLYVNGDTIARELLPAAVAESPELVQIGNWNGENRSFNGWIEEVLIAKNAKTEEMVISETKRLSVDRCLP